MPPPRIGELLVAEGVLTRTQPTEAQRADIAFGFPIAKTIGDLERFTGARAGFGYEFLERPDGLKGLSAAYGLRFAAPPRTMDLNLIYRAVAAKEIDVTAGDATSGQIDALDLAVLEDDRHYFPAYEAVPLVRAAAMLRHPEIGDAIRRLSGAISAAEATGCGSAAGANTLRRPRARRASAREVCAIMRS